MTSQQALLTKIHRACETYPENFLGGYILSLIEGEADEQLLTIATVRDQWTTQLDLFNQDNKDEVAQNDGKSGKTRGDRVSDD
jgi:hypothetical protein